MPEHIYEILALGARWWFILLGALIVLRSFGWLRRDGKRARRRLRQLPDAGMIGEMVVVTGCGHLEDGMVMSVPREGTLGAFRSCDLVVPADGVAPAHCDFSFQDGKGLLIYPRRRCFVAVDGEEFTGLRASRKHPMTHGSRLQIGDAVLRLRLFEGLETEAGMHVRDAWRLDQQDEYQETQEAWQATGNIYRQIPVQWNDSPENGQYADGYGQPPYPPFAAPQNGLQPEPGWQPEQYPNQQYPPQGQNGAYPPAQPSYPPVQSGWQPPYPPVQGYTPEQQTGVYSPGAMEDDRPRARERQYRSIRRRGDEEA